MMDIKAILTHLPHRFPFLLVDRVVELEPGIKIVGIKNVSFNENFFQGHFPGKPVMPGVLICEALAQVGAILAHASATIEEKDKLFVLTGLDRVKIKRAVKPGDQLRLELSSVKRRGPFWKMLGKATVDGKLVAQGGLSAMQVDYE